MKPLYSLLLVGLLSWLMAGCSEDCTTCPGNEEPSEREYPLIYDYRADYTVLTYNTKTLALIDSARYKSFPYDDLKFTSDGRYACYTALQNDYVTWVTDFATGDTLALAQGLGGHRLAISPDDKYLATFFGNDFTIFSLPALTVIFRMADIGSTSASFHPWLDRLYVTRDRYDSLLVLTLSTTAIDSLKVPLRDSSGKKLFSPGACVTPDGSKLFVAIYAFYSKTYFQLLDPNTYELIHEFFNVGGMPSVVPGKQKALLFISGDFDNPFPDILYEMDLKTLIVRKVLDGADLGSYYPFARPLQTLRLDYAPDGLHAFLMTLNQDEYGGLIIKLNLETYRIDGVINVPEGVATSINVYPYEIRKSAN